MDGCRVPCCGWNSTTDCAIVQQSPRTRSYRRPLPRASRGRPDARQGRRTSSPAEDDEGGAFSRPDGHRRRVVEEVLISADPALGVRRQRGDGFGLCTDRARHGQVARGEGNPDRHADSDTGVEQAQEDSNCEHEEEPGAATATASIAITWPYSCPDGLPPGSSDHLLGIDRSHAAQQPVDRRRPSSIGRPAHHRHSSPPHGVESR